jgi:hypothetical protein
MRFYNPRNLEPNTNQFYTLVRAKISSSGQQSFSYAVVQALYQNAESIYRTLDFHTQPSLAVFRTTDKYLTASQEHDLLALTASYIFQLTYNNYANLIELDNCLTEDE